MSVHYYQTVTVIKVDGQCLSFVSGKIQWCSPRGQALASRILEDKKSCPRPWEPWPWPRGSWPWLQARKFYFVGCFVSMRFADFFKISFKHAVYCRPFSVLLSHHPSFSLAYGLYFISYVYLTLHKYVLLQCLGMGLHQFALFFLAFVDTVNLLTHFVAITVISYHVVMYLSHHLSSHFFMWENR